ncbi:MAG: pitrilysin family protein, partial [Thermodesulfobacteriota bacterium]|nr:pitrilysin family protein [Thermodesulfobacteriota bacterium]
MSRFLKNFALSLVLIFLVAFPARAVEPVKHTLANGLDVILIENHRAPVVSMMVYVKVGSASEGPDEIGLAHLMEHMLFKGTTRRGPGEIAREVEAAGGRINAFTSFDQTVFYIDMAGRFAVRGLDILGDMVFNPTLAPEEFSREKEVVIEEIRRGEDTPDRKLSQALFAQAFKTHPYGRPVIGFVSNVRNISRETAVDFHQRWYKPGNMILVVAGDFRPAEVRPLIEQIFGRVSGGPVPVHDCQAEPPQEQTRTVILRSGVKTARLGLGLHVPEFKSGDVPALDILAVILGQGRTSRLYRRVKREKELVHSISAGAYTPQDPGLFVINAQLEPDMVLPALKAVMTEVSALGAIKVTPDELARAKLNIRADFIHSRVTMSGEARTAAYYEALADDFRAKDRYLTDLDQITAADLKAVASK